jgi:dGTPase
LGHTPFGHMGEDVLNELFAGGFRHNEQSLRVVDYLENNGNGLNLTWEVRDGILNHSKTRVIEIMGEKWGRSGTLEGEICKIADMVAYINHDIDDAIRAGIIKETDLPAPATKILGHTRAERINRLVCDIIGSSWSVSGLKPVKSRPAIKMSPRVKEAAGILHQFLYDKVYNFSSLFPDAENARKVVRNLYNYFNDNRALLPPEYHDPKYQVVDYIASMTDQYALRKVQELGLT